MVTGVCRGSGAVDTVGGSLPGGSDAGQQEGIAAPSTVILSSDAIHIHTGVIGMWTSEIVT